jgi:BirA family biotin operon repressor/biotin-[acetyl-CoA-carboxylase] ligase
VITAQLSLDAGLLKILRAAERHLTTAELSEKLHVAVDELPPALARLTEAGYAVEMHPHLGWRFVADPDRLIPEDLAGLLEGCSLVREILVLAETASTNDLALQLGRNGASAGLLIFAEKQTAGRGRMGRRWESPRYEGLWFSLLLRPEFPISEWSRLTTWAAVAVAEALDPFTVGRAQIKWPNDIFLAGRKAVGILIESALGADHHGFAVLGIGVNVNQTRFPAELSGKATSLRMHIGQAVDRQSLAAAILRRLEHWYPKLRAGFPEIVAAAASRAFLFGQEVSVQSGETAVRGQAESLDENGALQIRTNDGSLISVSAGEATLSTEAER